MRCKVSCKSVVTEEQACKAFEELSRDHETFCQLQREGRAFRDASATYFWCLDLERRACKTNGRLRPNETAVNQFQPQEPKKHSSPEEACKPAQEGDASGIKCKQEPPEETKKEDAEENLRGENKLVHQRKCKRPREAGAPKGPTPAFAFFEKEMWSHTRATCPAASRAEVTKRVFAAWLMLSVEESEKYNDLARRDRDRTDEQVNAVNAGQKAHGLADLCGEELSSPAKTDTGLIPVGTNSQKKRPRWKMGVIKLQRTS